MARPNKKGNSFCSLQLEKSEEEQIKKYIEQKDISAKQLLRYLIRKHLKELKEKQWTKLM